MRSLLYVQVRNLELNMSETHKVYILDQASMSVKQPWDSNIRPLRNAGSKSHRPQMKNYAVLYADQVVTWVSKTSLL